MTECRTIIVFSGKQYSGKDTVAKIMLSELPSFKRVAIGDSIKIEYGKREGLSLEEIEKNKAQYRSDLIKLGNWGRSISQTFWIEQIMKNNNSNLIVTDVRLKYELDFFNKLNAISIRVNSDTENRAKRGILTNETDLTETDLDDITSWSFVIDNNSSYEDLKEKTFKIIETIKLKLN